MPDEATRSGESVQYLFGGELGDMIRRERRSRKLTQEQAAALLGVRAQTLGSWEAGQRPQRRFFSVISEFLDLADSDSVAALVGHGPSRPAVGTSVEFVLPSGPLSPREERIVDALITRIGTGVALSQQEVGVYIELLRVAAAIS